MTKEILNKEEKIRSVRKIYEELDIRRITELKIKELSQRGIKSLKNLPVAGERKEPLLTLVTSLINRNN